MGLGVGGEWAIGHSMVAEAVADDRRGRASSWLQAGEPVGVALAAIAGFVLMPRFGWRAILDRFERDGASRNGRAKVDASCRTTSPRKAVTRSRTLRRAKVGSRMAIAWVLGVFKLGTYWTCYTWLPDFSTKGHAPVAPVEA